MKIDQCYFDNQSKFDQHINQHVRDHYLDPAEPRKLGGRAAGLQGQVGSTNGVEKRGGILKTKYSSAVKKYSGEERCNFVHMFGAIALDEHFSFSGKGGVKEYYSENPTLSVSDYRIIRLLHEWKTGSPISSDILYYICLDEHGAMIDPTKAIGCSSVSFNLYFPQAILYQVAREMMSDTIVLMQSQSFFALTSNESSRRCNLSSTDPNHWHNIISNFNITEQKVFKHRMLQALINDTIEPRKDETTIQYLQRKGQRRSELSRHGILGKKQTAMLSQRKRGVTEREREMAKWKKNPNLPLTSGDISSM